MGKRIRAETNKARRGEAIEKARKFLKQQRQQEQKVQKEPNREAESSHREQQ